MERDLGPTQLTIPFRLSQSFKESSASIVYHRRRQLTPNQIHRYLFLLLSFRLYFISKHGLKGVCVCVEDAHKVWNNRKSREMSLRLPAFFSFFTACDIYRLPSVPYHSNSNACLFALFLSRFLIRSFTIVAITSALSNPWATDLGSTSAAPTPTIPRIGSSM